MEVNGQLHAPTALPVRKGPQKMLGGPQIQSRRGGEENISIPLPGIEPRRSYP